MTENDKQWTCKPFWESQKTKYERLVQFFNADGQPNEWGNGEQPKRATRNQVYAYKMQYEVGDINTERAGGDWELQRWDAWNSLKGMDKFTALVDFNRLAEQVLEKLAIVHENPNKAEEDKTYKFCVD